MQTMSIAVKIVWIRMVSAKRNVHAMTNVLTAVRARMSQHIAQPATLMNV